MQPDGLGPPTDPFTHVIRCGDTIYVAGQISLDENNDFVGVGRSRRAGRAVLEEHRAGPGVCRLRASPTSSR